MPNATKRPRETNPWRRFPHHEGALALAWAAAGNVALLTNGPHDPRDSRGRPGATLWAMTVPLVREAASALGLRVRRVATDPQPHLALTGLPLDRAKALCGPRLTRASRAASRRLLRSTPEHDNIDP